MSRESLNKTHIKYAPISDEIVVAEMAKNGRVALNRVERTSDFLDVLLQWCGIGESRELVQGDKVIAKVTITAVERELAEDEKLPLYNEGSTTQ